MDLIKGVAIHKSVRQCKVLRGCLDGPPLGYSELPSDKSENPWDRPRVFTASAHWTHIWSEITKMNNGYPYFNLSLSLVFDNFQKPKSFGKL